MYSQVNQNSTRASNKPASAKKQGKNIRLSWVNQEMVQKCASLLETM